MAAVDKLGGQNATARLIGVSQPSVWRWVRHRQTLPAQHVLAIEAATGISRHRLRPDVYGPGVVATAPAADASGEMEPAR